MTGPKFINFRFRWLAHDNGVIDYSTDADQVMYLDASGNLVVKNSINVPTAKISGLVGVGTTDPKVQLHLVKGGNIVNAGGEIGFGANPNSNPMATIRGSLEYSIGRNDAGNLIFATRQYTGSTEVSDLIDRMVILHNGNVGIGVNYPTSMLAVNGTVTAKQVKVTQTGWPDFVFDSTYALRSLESLEGYITVYKHLPGIATATEIIKSGNDLGQTDANLLLKIEELTVYLIDQNKEIDSLKGEMRELKNKNEKLTKAFNYILLEKMK